jgi:pimeloyl-ACP methyl ester carboxylesterase
MKRRLFLGLFPGLAAMGAARSAEAVPGVVLLHGKQARPSDLADIAGALRSVGCKVATPEMPWTQRREYDVPYAAALEEVGAAMKQLQSEGAQRLVVGGHSLGANAALAYAASGRPVAGVFALAPGHVPEAPGFRRSVASGVEKAREMVARGAGEEKAWFPDTNQGRQRQVRTTAAAYLSYFDPEGPGSLVRSCRSLPAGVPLFMAVGESEPILPYARDTLFASAPRNDRSVFLAVPGDHFSAPRAALPRLTAWLQGLG